MTHKPPRGADPAGMVRFFGDAYCLGADGFIGANGDATTESVNALLEGFSNKPFPPAPGGAWMTFRELDGAGPLSVGFANNTNKLICSEFGADLSALEIAVSVLGGVTRKPGLGFDLVVDFPALPNVPIRLQFNADEPPFPAQCALCFRESTARHLDIRSLFTLGTYLVGRLCEVNRHP